WDHHRDSPSGRSQASVRDLALLINAQVMGLENQVEPLGTGTDESWGESALAGDESVFTETNYQQIANLLFRYMANTHVTASMFETESKSTLNSQVRSNCEDDDEDCSNARNWFEEYIGDPGDIVSASS